MVFIVTARHNTVLGVNRHFISLLMTLIVPCTFRLCVSLFFQRLHELGFPQEQTETLGWDPMWCKLLLALGLCLSSMKVPHEEIIGLRAHGLKPSTWGIRLLCFCFQHTYKQAATRCHVPNAWRHKRKAALLCLEMPLISCLCVLFSL